MQSKIENPKRWFQRKQRQAHRFFSADWMFRQFIPIQSVNRTLLDYDATFYGKDSIYSPEVPADDPRRLNRALQLHYQPVAIPRPYYFTIQNAVTVLNEVIDLDNPERVFLENYPEVTQWIGPANHRFDMPARRRAIKFGQTAPVEIENAYWFSCRGWENYYHFIVDSCLRYVDLKAEGAVDDHTKILVYNEPTKWQRYYMNLLGIADRQIVVTGLRQIRVKNVVISASRRQRFACAPDAMRSFRDQVFSKVDTSDAKTPSKFYISRSLSKLRQVTNEAKVEEVLGEYGYETVYLEKLSAPEQIALFKSATHIVGPHGAGLTNLIYATAPHVVELIPYDRWGWGYFIPYTDAVGGQHVPIVGQGVEGDTDFTIDLDALRQAVTHAKL